MPTIVTPSTPGLLRLGWTALLAGALLCSVPAAQAVSAGTVIGSGHAVDDARVLGSFRRIALKGSIDARVQIGPRSSAIVHADDNVVRWVTTRVEGDTLVIDLMPHTLMVNRTPVKVEISTPQLEAARLLGSGDLDVVGLQSGRFQAELLGSGELRASGRVDQLDARLDGSGDMQFGALVAARAEVRLNGSGDIHVQAVQSLDAHLSGSGDVLYRGRPAQLAGKVSGSGEVRAEP